MISPLALFIVCMLCMFGLGLLVIDWIRDEIKRRRKDQQELRAFIGYIEGANDDAQAKQIADSLPPSGAVLPPALALRQVVITPFVKATAAPNALESRLRGYLEAKGCGAASPLDAARATAQEGRLRSGKFGHAEKLKSNKLKSALASRE
jgi:hypothetical protein